MSAPEDEDRSRDPKDERRVIVALTDKGLALRDQAVMIPEKILCQLDLPLEELGALRDRLKTLAV
jgi:DNA-binding MarR family transcriptional regulator